MRRIFTAERSLSLVSASERCGTIGRMRRLDDGPRHTRSRRDGSRRRGRRASRRQPGSDAALLALMRGPRPRPPRAPRQPDTQHSLLRVPARPVISRARAGCPKRSRPTSAPRRPIPRSAQIRAEIAGLHARQNKSDEAIRAAHARARARSRLRRSALGARHHLRDDARSAARGRRARASRRRRADRPATGARPRPASRPASSPGVDAAISHLEQARPGRLFDNGLHLTLGRLYLTRRAWDKAIDVLSFVVEREPDAVEAGYLLAQAYDGAGKTRAGHRRTRAGARRRAALLPRAARSRRPVRARAPLGRRRPRPTGAPRRSTRPTSI